MENLKYFPITKSTLDAMSLGKFILNHYDLPLDSTCELMSRGVNDIYIIKNKNKSFAARVLRSNSRTEEDLSYEMDLILFYINAGFEAARPIPSKDNKYFIPILAPEGIRYLTIFNWVDGSLLSDQITKKNINNFGEFIAGMHNVNLGFNCQKRIKVDSSAYIKKYLPSLVKLINNKEDTLFYEKIALNACKQLDGLKKDILPYGATHADIHFGNVFINKSGDFSLIDWDTCGDDYLFKELTSFTWLSTYLDKPSELNEIFMQGYKKIRKPKKAEIELYPLFLCIRHLHVICGVSKSVNIIGHNILGFNHNLAKYKKMAFEFATNAGLI